MCVSWNKINNYFYIVSYFDVSLIVHLSITLANDQLNAQMFSNTYITILYMFRTISCSSSGGQILLIQHLLSSLSVSERPVHRFFLNLCTGRSLTESVDTRCCIIPEVVLIQLSSWRWTHSCSKHVENSNKHIIKEIVRQVDYLPKLCKSGYLNSVLIILYFSSFVHFFLKSWNPYL
jgi:hypothetical protein